MIEDLALATLLSLSLPLQKILAPGLRLGWVTFTLTFHDIVLDFNVFARLEVHASPANIQRLTEDGVIDSGGCPSPLVRVFTPPTNFPLLAASVCVL
jgi:hypothetical protein